MKIAFASCMNRRLFSDQPIWKDMAQVAPDYLFLLGDQIYMDYFPDLGAPADWSFDDFATHMRAEYEAQWNERHFSDLVNQLRQDGTQRVHGTWDDHDFAWNNACGRHVSQNKKDISRQLFCQRMNITPAGAGVQYAIDLLHGGLRIGKAIFLDTRWYRDDEGDDRDLLGAEQYEFLKRELHEPLALTVICAGTPMRATGKGWTAYKHEYQRVMKLIGERKVIFLSGDIHENAFLPPSLGTRLYEVISSGAAIKKYAFAGTRRNYGILDWNPTHTDVRLVDKRGSVAYRIDNETYDFEEME